MRIKVKVFFPAEEQKVSKKSGNFYLVSLKGDQEINQELVELLAVHFKLPPENIRLVSGFSNKIKYLEIIGEKS